MLIAFTVKRTRHWWIWEQSRDRWMLGLWPQQTTFLSLLQRILILVSDITQTLCHLPAPSPKSSFILIAQPAALIGNNHHCPFCCLRLFPPSPTFNSCHKWCYQRRWAIAFMHVFFLFLFVVACVSDFRSTSSLFQEFSQPHRCLDLHHICNINMHSPMFLCIHVKNKQQRHKCLSKS